MAYSPKRDTCETCLYFIANEKEGENGECHRNPPSYIARQHLWDFASVDPNNTCGEFDSTISDDHVEPKNCH